MKKIKFFQILGLLFSCLFILSCSDNDDPIEQKVKVNLVAIPVIEETFDASKINGLEVSITDMRTLNVTKHALDAEGKVAIEIYKGTYNLSIESEIEDSENPDNKFVYTAKMENCAISNNGQEIKLNLHTFPANTNSANLIFSELFFNGETNSGRMMHPDQYIVIFNPTQEDLYADGLSIATTVQPSIIEKEGYYDQYMPNKVPITGFITIPGSGKEHIVKAGDKLVIAWTAIDHSRIEGYENAVDLSGADFEVYIPNPESKDVDNPEVPNVIITESLIAGGLAFHPRGFYSPLMFKLENGNTSTIETFVKNNTKDYTSPAGKVTPLISVSKELILDGVVTGDRPLVTRTLPEDIDRGYIYVSGCHRQELVIRKEIKIGTQIFYKDTNNSDVDMEIRKGQTPYPKGWRNAK